MKALQIFALMSFSSFVWAGPPSRQAIELKTNTRTFNHVQDFALQDGELWYRMRNGPQSDWQQIALEGKKSKAVYRDVKADGANLMLSDTDGVVHYKKVVEEWRDSDLVYGSKDIALTSKWIPHWFSTPLLRLPQFVPITDYHLKLPKGHRSWAMSHRGTYNYYFDDVQGQQHSAFHMVTTAYAIPEDGKDILYADPFLVRGFARSIRGPHVDFVGDKIAASASMLFLVGERNKETEYYVRLADFDTLGKNPILPGFWNDGATGMTEWYKVQTPTMNGRAALTKNITIFQTGMGNAARELRIEGLDHNGSRGFYRKLISEDTWQFRTLSLFALSR